MESEIYGWDGYWFLWNWAFDKGHISLSVVEVVDSVKESYRRRGSIYIIWLGANLVQYRCSSKSIASFDCRLSDTFAAGLNRI